ncbi:Holliday junction branch migration protein RuvA [bacterium]|nr:Holliday junction branch migration protein RuvA [bacterium]
MIAYLNGKIINKSGNYIILKAGSIGYKVFINDKFFYSLNSGEEIEVYTYQYVREDALDLYGFKSLDQLDFFEILLSISGIGPKSALKATAIARVDDFKEYISRGDSALLQQVPGIGKKTAEKVVVELRDKVGFLSSRSGDLKDSDDSNNNITSDEIDALIALGYSMVQAREALREVDPAIKDSGQRIREALKNIK